MSRFLFCLCLRTSFSFTVVVALEKVLSDKMENPKGEAHEVVASSANGNGETSVPMSRADRERVMDVVFLWMSELDANPEREYSIYCLSQMAQTCKTARAIIMPRIEAAILVLEQENLEEEEREKLIEDFWEESCYEPYEKWSD